MSYFIAGVKTRLSRYAALFTCSIVLLGVQSCKSQEASSIWTDQPMTIDGKLGDWANVPVLYYEKEDIGVGICNDSDNIYVTIKFRNPAYARLIRMGGLNVWVDRHGDKSEDFGLIYNGAPNNGDMKMPRGEGAGAGEDRFGGMPNAPDFKDRHPVELRLVDKQSIFQEAVIASDGSEGPRAACDTSLSFFTYEFSLPLRESEGRYYGIGAEAGNKVMIGLKVSAPERKSERPGGMGGGPGGGMGGPGGGMGGGGQRPHGMGDSQKAQKIELWLATTLADHQSEPEKK